MKTFLIFLLASSVAFAQSYSNLSSTGAVAPLVCPDTNVPTYSSGQLVCGAGGGGGGGGDMYKADNLSGLTNYATARANLGLGSSATHPATDFQAALGFTPVPDTRQVNGHALTTDVTVTKGDVGLGSVTNDAQLKAVDLDTDGTLSANSDSKIPSQKAVKTYADTKFTFPALTAGSVLFSDGSTLAQNNSQFFWDNATARLFMGSPVSINGSNAGVQYSDAVQANRAQIKLHSYVNAASIAGVSTLTSKSGVVGINAAIGASQDYSKWTAQASPSAGAAPIVGTWAFKSAASGIGGNQVPSDYHISLMNQAGALGDRFYLTSEGALQLPGYGAGYAKFDASGNVTSAYPSVGEVTGALSNVLTTGHFFLGVGGIATDQTPAQAAALLPNFIGDTGSGGTAGLVPAPPAGTYEPGYFLEAGGGWELVDQQKTNYAPFSLIAQVPQPAGTDKLQNAVVAGHFAYVSGGSVTSTLAIYDIKDQSAPYLESNISATGTYGVCVNGNMLYIPASGSSNLYIYDVTNPNTPVLKSTLGITGGAGSIYSCAVSGTTVYLATQSKGLTVVDASVPTAPVQTYQEGGTLNKSFGVAMGPAGSNTVFTTNYQTATPWTVRYFKTWTLTGAGTPTVPSLVNTYTLPANTKPNGITVFGNTAYVTDTNTGRIHVIDVTTPTAPNALSTMTPTGTFNSGFVAQKASATSPYVYVPSGSSATVGGIIDMFDCTNLSACVKVSSTNTATPNSVFGGIGIYNGFIYAGDYGIAPGSAGNLDVFTMPLETASIGNLTVAHLNVTSSTPPTETVSPQTTNYTVALTDQILIGDATGGAFAFTLPTSASAFSGGKSQIFTFTKKDSSANAITVAGNGAETIMGSANVGLIKQYQTITVYTDGGGLWYVR